MAVAAALAVAAAVWLAGKYSRTAQQPAPDRVGQENAPTALPSGSRAGSTPPRASVELAGLILRLKDDSLPLSERAQAIRDLADSGTPDALEALHDALSSASPEIRLTVAEALGKSSSAKARALLLQYLKDSDEALVRSTIERLGQDGSALAANTLSQLLTDPLQHADARAEAAAALGALDQPGVVEALSQAGGETKDTDLLSTVLSALGQHDFSETESFFRNYLQAADTPSEQRVEALDTLAQAQGDPTGLLVELAADGDPDVRAAAARALSSTEATGNAGDKLLGLLQQESEPDVRLRLYQALRNQESFDAATALGIVQGEKDPSARIAGLDLIAKAVRDNPSADLQAFFSQTAIPELKTSATTGETLDDRQAAVIALTRAHTPEAMAALQDLARQIAAAQQAATPAPASQPPAGTRPPKR
jgi:HEAT repeat protein